MATLTDLTARWLPGMVRAWCGTGAQRRVDRGVPARAEMAVYYATKAYVLSLTEAIAEELRGTGVTATAFCPGAFDERVPVGRGHRVDAPRQGRRLPTSAAMARAALAAMDRGVVVAVPGAINKAGAIAPRSRRAHWSSPDGRLGPVGHERVARTARAGPQNVASAHR